ncbi:MAG: patatin-like phospholipase family protein [Bacteroidales bacterium]|nr:patatin-like phospholipase family protein [Bacteroidales bacterium]MBQ7819818.1 patatin-like phospholipase family protein [Bacteroidales bacterium]
MSFVRNSIIVLTTLLLISSSAFSQSVGLVMSGGGAKGIAHIGVIKALEENEIPIDYITGTSMGAIVGAFYAMGYTPEEMLEIVKSTQFESWSTGKIESKHQFYFRKGEPSPRFAAININIGDKNKKVTPQFLPSSLINPVPMNYGFLQLFSAYTAQSDSNFDNLFVPFRCVASDVYNKTAVIFKDGDLGDAVRASMTFPFVFKPIEKDSILLYDGGIYNNFPVDVMRNDFAPDFIIGSKVAGNPSKPKEGDIMAQIDAMVMQKTDYNVNPEEGVLISFKLDSIISLLDFAKADMIYQIGYEKGTQMADSIKGRINRRLSEDSRSLMRMQWKSKTPELLYDKIEVEGGNNTQQAFIKKQFEVEKNSSNLLDIEGAEKAYYKLMSDNKISEIIPHSIYNDSTGLFTLELKTKLKDNFQIGLGGYISSGNTNMIYIDTKYRTLSLYSMDVDLNGYVGRSYNSGMLSVKFELPSKLPMYLKIFGVFSKKKYYESERLFVQKESPTFITKQEAFAKIRIGLPFLTNSKTEISLGYGYLTDTYYPSNVIDYANTHYDKSNYSLFMGSVKFEHNTLNNVMYSSKGRNIFIVGEFITGKERFKPADVTYGELKDKHSWLVMHAKATKYFNPNKHFSIGILGDLMLSTKNFNASYTSTIVHAPTFSPTPHSKTVFNEAFRANQFIAVGVIPIWEIIKNLQLRGDFYCFTPFFKIEQSYQNKEKAAYGKFMHNPEFMGELTMAYNLPFASIGMFVNYYSYPNNNWNFGINLGILLYNPKFIE